jgi:hypothetical protein
MLRTMQPVLPDTVYQSCSVGNYVLPTQEEICSKDSGECSKAMNGSNQCSFSTGTAYVFGCN